MFDIDLLLAFAFMALLFLRQVSILKQANKINYSPLMICVGAISSLIHFILHPDTSNVILLMRESLFPLLVSLFLYIIMNIFHQTRQSENSKQQNKLTKVLINEITQLKEFIAELESRMSASQQDERNYQEEMRSKFKEDIRALDIIQANQTYFLDKFDNMEFLHKEVSKGLEYFTSVQLPELDNVVHKHIDILRVAEQDHYNKLNILLAKAVDNKGNITQEIANVKSSLQGIKNISHTIADTITQQTVKQLAGLTKSFESQLLSLKSHTESVKTGLTEGENTLYNIRKQSEMIMKQMLLSSNKMNELEKQNASLHDLYENIDEILKDVESIKFDYQKSQSQLSFIVGDLVKSKNEEMREMQLKIDDLSSSLIKKMDESIEKIEVHNHSINDDISQNLQVLSKKAKLKNGYAEFENL